MVCCQAMGDLRQVGDVAGGGAAIGASPSTPHSWRSAGTQLMPSTSALIWFHSPSCPAADRPRLARVHVAARLPGQPGPLVLVGDALEHGPEQVAPGVPGGQPDPGASHVRLRQEHAALDVREPQQPVRPGWHGGQLVEARRRRRGRLPARGDLVPEPAQARPPPLMAERVPDRKVPSTTEWAAMTAWWRTSGRNSRVQMANTLAVPARSYAWPGATTPAPGAAAIESRPLRRRWGLPAGRPVASAPAAEPLRRRRAGRRCAAAARP